ncbi:MAG: ABC transporter substrate-binding protein, partial [Candidatus Bathyarchaeia archaeon]
RMHIPELILNWPEEPEEYVHGLRSFKGLPILACVAILFNFQLNPVSPYIGSGQLDGEGIPPDFFSDVDVRKGFAYAFDYDRYIREVFMGEASQPATPVIEGLPYHNPEQDKYSFNLTKAEQHFRAAWRGEMWANGFTMGITYNRGNIPRMKVCEILKSGVESLNPKFHIEIHEVDWYTFLKQLVDRELTLFLFGDMAILPDSYELLYSFMHSEGDLAYFQGYSNPTVDALIEEGMRTMDETRRLIISYELQRIYHEDCIGIPRYQPFRRHWERDRVQGWYYNPIYPGGYYYHYWKGYKGDTDKDYDVDLDDLYSVLIGYGLTLEEAMARYGVPAGTDVDGDGWIDLDDLFWVLVNYDS